jgi:hypothetical protein
MLGGERSVESMFSMSAQMLGETQWHFTESLM